RTLAYRLGVRKCGTVDDYHCAYCLLFTAIRRARIEDVRSNHIPSWLPGTDVHTICCGYDCRCYWDALAASTSGSARWRFAEGDSSRATYAGRTREHGTWAHRTGSSRSPCRCMPAPGAGYDRTNR